MKILFIIPTLKNGGAEKVISDVTSHLPENVDADILINSISDLDFPTGAKIISLGMVQSKKMGLFYQFIVMMKRITKLYRLKRDNHYDDCISFMDSANIANILTGKKYSKVIISVRTSIKKAADMRPEYKYIVSPLIKLLYNRADKVIAISPGIRKELVEEFGLQDNKVVTIENRCDISLLKQQAEEAWDSEDELLEGKNLIVAVGRLVDSKGQWHLIRAFRSVCEKDATAVLLILGDGSLNNYLRQVANNCGVSEKVIFKGFVKNPYKYIAKADVFVMPSQFEGYGNALAEAICLGIPCIATDYHTGAREMLAPELVDDAKKIDEVYLAQYGILTPLCSGFKYKGREELEDSEKKMAEAILLLLQDAEKKKHYTAQSVERSKDLGFEGTITKWMQALGVEK